MNPRPHHQKVQERYGDVGDERYLEEEQGRVETFTESLDVVARFAPGGRLLDVGCHVGTFLEIAERGGFDVAGVEPSRWAADVARGAHPRRASTAARSRTPRCRRAATTSSRCGTSSSTCPIRRSTCGRSTHALRPGGIFALSTMDVDALFPRVAGSRWPWYMQMHLVYFSRRTLAEMLRREGFHIVDVRAPTCGASGSRTWRRASTRTCRRSPA